MMTVNSDSDQSFLTQFTTIYNPYTHKLIIKNGMAKINLNQGAGSKLEAIWKDIKSTMRSDSLPDNKASEVIKIATRLWNNSNQNQELINKLINNTINKIRILNASEKISNELEKLEQSLQSKSPFQSIHRLETAPPSPSSEASPSTSPPSTPRIGGKRTESDGLAFLNRLNAMRDGIRKEFIAKELEIVELGIVLKEESGSGEDIKFYFNLRKEMEQQANLPPDHIKNFLEKFKIVKPEKKTIDEIRAIVRAEVKDSKKTGSPTEEMLDQQIDSTQKEITELRSKLLLISEKLEILRMVDRLMK